MTAYLERLPLIGSRFYAWLSDGKWIAHLSVGEPTAGWIIYIWGTTLID